MRGKPRSSVTLPNLHGITPADAGKTNHKGRRNLCDRDHPRGCGENFATSTNSFIGAGSPPRMRGKLKAEGFCDDEPRITPADAGKTTWQTLTSTPTQDHPRGCGENKGGLVISFLSRGSPPRMRGKPHSPYISPPRVRITPADAGKTNGGNRCLKTKRDHPRGCGENQHQRRD